MKKIAQLVLISTVAIVLSFALSGCIASSILPDSNSTSNGGASTTCSHIWIDATCEVPKICSKCGKTSGQALGHTTTSGTCSRCGHAFGDWILDYYVDEFNNPTSVSYIRRKSDCTGVFSNSATTNSTLDARILIDSQGIAIKLFEYGYNEVKAYTSTDYTITVLDSNDQKHIIYGTIYKNGDRIHLNDWTLIQLLIDNEEISIHIKENSKYGVNSTYLFTVNRSNFTEIYNQLK